MKHDPDRHQDLISSCYSHTAPLQNILSEFGSIFSSCPANKQTNAGWNMPSSLEY